MFFLDLPGRDQKDAIWGIFLGEYGLAASCGGRLFPRSVSRLLADAELDKAILREVVEGKF